MANHKSALKRIRSNRAKQLRNKYKHKTTRNAVRNLRALTEKDEAVTLFPKVQFLFNSFLTKITILEL